MENKYLVRTSDWLVFESFEGLMRPKESKQKPYEWFTYDILKNNFGFISIEEEDVPYYLKKCKEHYAIASKNRANDHHGNEED